VRARPTALPPLVLAVAAVAATAGPGAPGSQIRVPQDVATVPLAIARAQPGDSIVLAAGTYPGGYVVPEGKDDITVRGVDRNTVVLDGGNTRKDGILVRADGVSILNLSAHNFRRNAFYWLAADRFRGSYLTAWNVGAYGIYVEDAEGGVLDHDYVSGAADAAYYVGECRPCNATLSEVVATLSAVGYSGTNATDVVIRDSYSTGTGRESFRARTRTRRCRHRSGRPSSATESRAAVGLASPSAPRSRASSVSASRWPAGTRTW
jgi:hypothetical protein